MLKKRQEHIFDYLFGLLILILPFSLAIPNIILGVLFLLFLIDIKKVKFPIILQNKPLIILYGFFGYFFIKAFLNQTFMTDIGQLSRYLFVLVIPILFLKVKDVRAIQTSFILAGVLMIFKSLWLITEFYLIFHNLPLGDGNITNSLLALERPYAGFIATCTVLLSLERVGHKGKYSSLFWISAALGVFFILLISARNSFLTLLFLFSLYLIFYFKAPTKKKALFVLLVVVLISTAIGFNKNFLNRFHVKQTYEKTIAEMKVHEPRAVIWPCAFEITKHKDFNFLFGFQSQEVTRDRLSECYGTSIKDNESKRKWFLQERFNTHSQFIDAFLSGGLIGLTLLIGFLFLSVYQVKKHFFSLAIFTAIAFFFVFENSLYRQLGCYLFSIFTALYLKKENEQTN